MVTHLQRDDRLREIPWLGSQGLAQLRTRRIAILGLGNIGGETARHLAMLGIPLLLVDRGLVEPANLGTQGFTDEDLGLLKVEARRRALRRLNPHCPIDVLALDLETMGFAALRSADLWLCCLDSLRLRVRVNEMALRLGIPWIDAAIDGTGRSFARVATYDPPSDSACFLCGYGPADVQHLVQQGQPMPCQTLTAVNDASPTQAVSAIGAVAAGMQVLWALEQLLNRPHHFGCEFLLNLDSREARSLRRSRDPNCVVGHESWVFTEGLTQSHSWGEVFAQAETLLGAPVTLTLLHRTLVTARICIQCGDTHHPYRLLDTLDRFHERCACGGSYSIPSSGLMDRFTRSEASEFLDQSLQQVGIPGDDVLIAQHGDRCCHLLIAPAVDPLSDSSRPNHDGDEKEGSHGLRV
ncbi:MAG: ThiF family adenylyltransferase [Nitrospira sp.]|nr:ThiF family adenylyltransferase [Nitrospira sp.]